MPKLINRKGVKEFILRRFKEIRAGKPMTRVSGEYLSDLEFYLVRKIEADIERHPSIGVTFKP